MPVHQAQPALIIGDCLLPGGSIQACALHLREGRIARVEPAGGRALDTAGTATGAAILELRPDDLLAPAFIDIHVHGAGGWAAEDGGDALQGMATTLVGHGVSAFLATGSAAPLGRSRELARTVAAGDLGSAARPADGDATPGARLLGVHLEGPALSPLRAGGHDVSALRTPRSLAAAIGRARADWDSVRVVTLAPELPGGLSLVRRLAEAGVVPSVGHTEATFEVAARAYRAGARSTTHLFNAMPPLSHRNPGVVGAALALAPFVELIADGIHVDGALLAPMARAIGPDRLILVSDALSLAASARRRSELAAGTVRVRHGRVTLADGTIAGGLLLLDGIVATAVAAGIPLGHALRAASENPARLLGLPDRGRLVAGAHADLVVVDRQGRLRRTLVSGREVAGGGDPVIARPR